MHRPLPVAAASILTLLAFATPSLAGPSGTGEVGVVSAGLQSSGLIVTFALPSDKTDPALGPDARVVTPAELVEPADPTAPFGKVIERES